MADLRARSGVKEQSLQVKVIRADGRVEDHGTVAYWNRNPLRRLAWRLRRTLRS